MNNTIQIQLPEEVYRRIEALITTTIEKALISHVSRVQAQPNRLTRAEAARALHVTYPTLRQYEVTGRLKPQRAGRRVLYDMKDIEVFLNSNK